MVTRQQDGEAAPYVASLGKYLLVYICILILAGLQFVIAYQHAAVTATLFRVLAVAIIEAGLAVIFFMHLGSENRTLVTWVAVVTLFVLAAMQCSWTDSFRMERDASPSYRSPSNQGEASQ
jgi:heme/copper-type cytochrome/quinol oxidase subunit 4